MVKSYGVGGGLIDYTVSFLGPVIVISRPRSLTTRRNILGSDGMITN